MSQTTLVASTGRETGSPASRRLRATDQIPGVLYGQGMTPVSVAVARRDLRVALTGPAGFNPGAQPGVGRKIHPAVIKDGQRHPVKRNVSHIDFLQVNMSETITVSVPLHITGEAKAVLADGGLVDPSVDNIEVECTPGNMPNEFTVDISAMVPGDVIRLSSLTMPAGVVALGDPDMAIVTAIHGSQGSESAPAAPAAE